MPVPQEQLDAYAELVAGVGVNVEPGQLFGVTAYVEHAPFVRAVARAAWAAGARDVDVRYLDEHLRKTAVELAPEDALGWSPRWLLERRESYGDRGAYLLVRGHPDPRMFEDVDVRRGRRGAVGGRAVGARDLAVLAPHGFHDRRVGGRGRRGDGVGRGGRDRPRRRLAAVGVGHGSGGCRRERGCVRPRRVRCGHGSAASSTQHPRTHPTPGGLGCDATGRMGAEP